jgi:hypothetical protein
MVNAARVEPVGDQPDRLPKQERLAILRKRPRRPRGPTAWMRHLRLQIVIAVAVFIASTSYTFRFMRIHYNDMESMLEWRRRQRLQQPVATDRYRRDELKTVAEMPMGSTFLSSLSKQQQQQKRHKFAIAYLIGGCSPEDPAHRYYFYNILISHDNMRREGSQADVVVFVQMSFRTPAETLPEEDVRILAARNIQIVYIGKNEHESFYSIMLDKFRVLSLTQYDRVLFSDGDVLFRGSLDYLYDLSVAGVLKNNLVLAGKTEPANGGLFMLQPTTGAVDRIRRVIREKEVRGAQLPYPHFDRTVGWGHVFEGHDYYELFNHYKKLTQWAFHGDFADQGLLYQWVKYEEKSVSIVFKDGIQNWGVNASTGELVLETFHRLNVLDTLSNRTKRECWNLQLSAPCQSPFTDYIHFTGTIKPWLGRPPDDWRNSTSPQGTWYRELHRLNQELGLGLDFANWRTGHRPLLGFAPLHVSAAKANYSTTSTS